MYRVLVSVDRNVERSVSQADYVADLTEIGDAVEAVVLYVFPDEDSLDPSDDETARSPEDIEAVRRVQKFFEERGIDYRTVGDRGDPVDAILAQSEQEDADTIVLGGRKRSATGKLLFGSVTQSVLRNTDMPVVVAGAAKEA